MSNHTTGRIDLYDSCSYRRFGAAEGYHELIYATVHKDGQPSIEARNHDDLQHMADCWNAIDSIGGDPATVGELVAALSSLTAACHGLADQQAMPDPSWEPAYNAAVTVLAKIPEAK